MNLLYLTAVCSLILCVQSLPSNLRLDANGRLQRDFAPKWERREFRQGRGFGVQESLTQEELIRRLQEEGEIPPDLAAELANEENPLPPDLLSELEDSIGDTEEDIPNPFDGIATRAPPRGAPTQDVDIDDLFPTDEDEGTTTEEEDTPTEEEDTTTEEDPFPEDPFPEDPFPEDPFPENPSPGRPFPTLPPRTAPPRRPAFTRPPVYPDDGIRPFRPGGDPQLEGYVPKRKPRRRLRRGRYPKYGPVRRQYARTGRPVLPRNQGSGRRGRDRAPQNADFDNFGSQGLSGPGSGSRPTLNRHRGSDRAAPFDQSFPNDDDFGGMRNLRGKPLLIRHSQG